MDLIKEYDFDSLNYLDAEYDNPVVQDAVLQLVANEMRTFTPSVSNYLSYLPYPSIKFSNSPYFQAEYKRVSKGGTTSKLDLSRYSVEKPAVGLDNDVQAWKASVANAKSQLEHQHNRATNLELLEKFSATTLINHNKAVEGMVETLKTRTAEVEKQILHVNSERKRSQEQARPQLDKLIRRRDEALSMCWRISASCANHDSGAIDGNESKRARLDV